MIRLLAAGFAAIVLSAPMASGAEPGEQEIAAILKSNLKKIQSYSFAYEGTSRRIPPDDVGSASADMDRWDHTYLGYYAFRTSDGATLLDVYLQPARPDAPLRRSTTAILRGKAELRDQTPGPDKPPVPPMVTSGGPGSLYTSDSPELFVYFWNLRRLAADPQGWGLQVLAWEVVDERRCLHVRFDEFYGMDVPIRPAVHLWLDLERGGSPIKIENHRNGVVIMRTSAVRLEPVSLPDGGEVWFPVHGETSTFSREHGEVPGKGYFHEVSDVVVDSLRLNQELKDDVFSVKYADRNRTAGGETLARARRQFEEAAKREDKSDAPRTDPRSVQKRLKADLAEADRQEERLEASSVARTPWYWKSVGTFAFGALAVALLIGAVVLRRMGR